MRLSAERDRAEREQRDDMRRDFHPSNVGAASRGRPFPGRGFDPNRDHPGRYDICRF